MPLFERSNTAREAKLGEFASSSAPDAPTLVASSNNDFKPSRHLLLAIRRAPEGPIVGEFMRRVVSCEQPGQLSNISSSLFPNKPMISREFRQDLAGRAATKRSW